MKKFLMCIIALCLILNFVGCENEIENNKPVSSASTTEEITSTEEETSSTQEIPLTQETASAQESQEQHDIVVDTEYYTIKIPKSWDTDCVYKITEGESYNYTLTFYNKANYGRIEGGHLFSIHLLTEFEDYTVYPAYDVLGSLEVYEVGSYNIIVTYPTDVQFSDETAKIYNKMADLIPDILETISFKDEYTYSKTPLPIMAE